MNAVLHEKMMARLVYGHPLDGGLLSYKGEREWEATVDNLIARAERIWQHVLKEAP